MIAHQQLEILEASALISLVQRQPELEYLFRHVLVQEAAYSSLLHADRRRLHKIVAQALESLFADRLDAHAGLLAEHFHEAADDEKTAEYAARAGDAAARIFAHPEARGHYARALEALSRLPASDDNYRRQVDTILKQVSASLRAEGPAQSLVRLQSAETLLDRLADPGESTHADRVRRARVHFWMGHASVHSGRMGEALRYMQQVLDEAQDLGDDDLLATPAAVVGRALALQGNFAKAAPLLSQALPALQKVANWPEWIITTAILGLARAAQGDVLAGIALCSEALARAEQLEYATGIGQAHVMLALIYSMLSQAAQRMAAESGAALTVAERVHDRLISYLAGSGLSLALSRLDRPVEAAAQLAKMDLLVQSLSASLVFADWFAATRAEITLRAGNSAEAVRLAEKAVAGARAVRGLWSEGLAQRVWGQALAALDPPQYDDAESHMRESMRLLDDCRAALEVAQTHVAWAMIRRAQGDAAGAVEHLGRAARQFEASGVTSELEHARQLISEIQRTM